MSGSVPVLRQSERIAGQPIVNTETGGGGAMAALSRSMGDLSRTLSGVGADMRARADEAQVGADMQEVMTRPVRDAAGNYTVPEPGDWNTRVGQRRNQMIQQRMADEAQLEGREQAVILRQQAGNDPARFAEIFRGWSEGRLEAMPEWVREQARGSFAQVGNQHFTAMSQHVIAREERNQQAGWAANVQMREQEMDALARAGRMDSPEYAQAQNGWSSLMDRGVRDGHLSREAADVQRQARADHVASVGVTRAALDRIGQGATNEDVLRDLDAEFDRRAVPTNQRERLRNLVESRLNERRAVQSEQRTEIGIEWTDMRARLTGGVAVPAAEVDDLARRAEGANARATAAEIRRTQEVYSDLRDAGTISLPELQRRHAATVQQVATNPNATSRQAILAEMLGQAITRRREAMRADPLGTAAQVHRNNPDGGQLVALDFSNPEALGAGLAQRAQQARRLGALEGMASTMPLLTAAEGGQMASVIRHGTRDDVVGLLTSLNRLPADTAARTLDGVIVGQGREQDARVGALMAAVAQTRSGNVAIAREIIDGSFVMQNVDITALRDGQLRRFFQRQPEFVAYANSPAALAAIQSAVEALYAQRVSVGFDASNPTAGRSTGSANREVFSEDIAGRALRQVAPTVTFNRALTALPTGMTAVQFEDRMRDIPPHVLAGAVGENDGRPLTPEILRRSGALQAVGDGLYQITIGNSVVRRGGQAFVLDVRQPWPAAPPDDFRNRLRQSESGQRIGIVNSEGFAGLYQFGTERLAEIGFYRPAPGEGRNGWRGEINIPGFPQVRTVQDFLRNPAAQEFAADIHFQRIDAAIDRLPGAAGRDRNGLRAVAHLGGEDGMRRFVETNGAYDPADSNGTKLSTYYRRFSRAS